MSENVIQKHISIDPGRRAEIQFSVFGNKDTLPESELIKSGLMPIVRFGLPLQKINIRKRTAIDHLCRWSVTGIYCRSA